MSRMTCDLCGTDRNVWHYINSQDRPGSEYACESCIAREESAQQEETLELAVEIAKLLDRLITKLKEQDRP